MPYQDQDRYRGDAHVSRDAFEALVQRVGTLERQQEKLADSVAEGLRWEEGEHAALQQRIADARESLQSQINNTATRSMRDTFTTERSLSEEIAQAIKDALGQANAGSAAAANTAAATTQAEWYKQTSVWAIAIITTLLGIIAGQIIHFP